MNTVKYEFSLVVRGYIDIGNQIQLCVALKRTGNDYNSWLLIGYTLLVLVTMNYLSGKSNSQYT